MTQGQCGLLGGNLGMAIITYIWGPQSVSNILGTTFVTGILILFMNGYKRESRG
jgi:hypothetical protein